MNNAWIIPRCIHRLDIRRPLPSPKRSPLLILLLTTASPSRPTCRRPYSSLLGAPAKKPPRKAPPAIPRPRIRYNAATLEKIFGGPGLPPPVANAVLAELQNRRVTGALVDVGTGSLPEHWRVTPEQAARALAFLRRERPMDEVGLAGVYAQRELDAERERQVEDIRLRAERWGIRKRDPEGDKSLEVAGKKKPPTGLIDRSSFIEKLAMDLSAKTKKKKMKKMEVERYYAAKAAEDYAEMMRAREEAQELIETKRNDNLKNWEELRKQAELPTEELLEERSAFSRLWRSALLAVYGIAVALYFVDPTVISTSHSSEVKQWSPAVATCLAITAINVLVCILWRHPRVGWYFNRYMMLSAGAPRAFSVLGCVFSHSQWLHLWSNTACLFAFGLPLHEEVGRTNFLALYAICGLGTSITTLAYHVLTKNLLYVSVGASGAIFGIMSLYFTLRDDRAFQIPYVGQVEYNTWYAMAVLVAYEAYDVMFGSGKNSNVCHFSGLAIGSLLGLTLRRKLVSKEGEQEKDK